MAGFVDTALMGHLGSEKYLVATSISTSVISMIFWSFGFLRMGTTGLVSQSLGRGDYREIVLTTLRNLSIAIIVGFIILFLKIPIFSSINFFFVISDESLKLINEYLSVRLFSAPAELAIYVLVGLYIGIQKTKSIAFVLLLMFLFLSFVINPQEINYIISDFLIAIIIGYFVVVCKKNQTKYFSM